MNKSLTDGGVVDNTPIQSVKTKSVRLSVGNKTLINQGGQAGRTGCPATNLVRRFCPHNYSLFLHNYSQPTLSDDTDFSVRQVVIFLCWLRIFEVFRRLRNPEHRVPVILTVLQTAFIILAVAQDAAVG